MAYVGDGAWCMSFQELLTCVRERIPVTAVVFHNGQWGAEKKNQVDFYGRRFVGSNLQNPNFAELARAMGAEGLRVEHADQVGDALRAACKAQSEGKTTVLEMMVSQELGDPFRRDALKQPVRFLKKYQPYVNQPFASGKRRCRSSRRDTRREDGRAPDPEVRMRSRGSGSGDPARPADASATSGPAARAEASAPRGRRQQERERWRAMDCSRRCAMPHCRRAGCARRWHIPCPRPAWARRFNARGRLYRAGAGGAARASRGCWRNRACRPAGWKSSTRPTTSWNRRGPRRRWRDGAVGMLMKGSLHSDHFMAAVVARESGLRTARRISHAFVMSVAAYPKLFILTDAAVNIAPTLAEKADIAQNAIDLARSLGVDRPKVAVLCATESVNPSMPATLDAAALSKMADRMQIRGALVDGPLALDNAISREAAELKGIASPVAGQADILLAPDIEAGNMLYKELTWLAGAGAAGLVLGTRVPVLLTSRADSVQARVDSCAIAALHARALAA